MPSELRSLLVGGTLVQFANGMVYIFLMLVITQFYQVGFETTVSLASRMRLISRQRRSLVS